jgi:hypothetical protein
MFRPAGPTELPGSDGQTDWSSRSLPRLALPAAGPAGPVASSGGGGVVMGLAPQTDRPADGSGARIVYGIAGGTLLMLLVVLLTSRTGQLLGDGHFAWAHALHAIMAFVFVVVSSVGLYQAFLLYAGRPRPLAEVRLVTYAIVAFSAFTIMFGNWLYVGYRAKDAASPKSFFLATSPDIHNIFFDFKEHTALFCLPLAVAAAFILWRYGQQALERVWLRNAVASLIVLNFVYFVIAFGLGAAITKLKGVHL